MITIVVAVGKNSEIGKGNQLLWHLPKDLKHFKEITNGHPVIMGRKTYDSIGKALPNRTNIVVTRKTDWFEEGILIVNTLKEALKHSKKIDEKVFVIGGGDIYKQCMEVADSIELTRVDGTFDADVFFPEINEKQWRIVQEECIEKDDKNAFDFCFQTFERIKKEEKGTQVNASE
ncbi:dihydrofolate reductase [Elizabethkingia occulta]|uniref:Dihydrofolate reductase n=1 Tax=Elizabethkingia occulta TaxID=1867263 RepID=A0A1T3M9W8_9FLAO|nr:dihydrofolate reductase [Elizabethkingia occulta]OPB92438.1 dihydrofolate reductase [Elizabethkingia occulta]OPC61458.1 dihydrofolate reductase [Elizabethkingia occulta]